MDGTLLWRYLLEHYIYWVYGQMNRLLEMDNANDEKIYVSQSYITNGVDYVMEKFGRYVLQMEFTMLEVYIRRNGKHQIRR